MAQAFPCSSSIWWYRVSVMPNLMNLCVLVPPGLVLGGNDAYRSALSRTLALPFHRLGGRARWGVPGTPHAVPLGAGHPLAAPIARRLIAN